MFFHGAEVILNLTRKFSRLDLSPMPFHPYPPTYCQQLTYVAVRHLAGADMLAGRDNHPVALDLVGLRPHLIQFNHRLFWRRYSSISFTK